LRAFFDIFGNQKLKHLLSENHLIDMGVAMGPRLRILTATEKL
jgi:uncharacterized ubiquitin-like protein YukD